MWKKRGLPVLFLVVVSSLVFVLGSCAKACPGEKAKKERQEKKYRKVKKREKGQRESRKSNSDPCYSTNANRKASVTNKKIRKSPRQKTEKYTSYQMPQSGAKQCCTYRKNTPRYGKTSQSGETCCSAANYDCSENCSCSASAGGFGCCAISCCSACCKFNEASCQKESKSSRYSFYKNRQCASNSCCSSNCCKPSRYSKRYSGSSSATCCQKKSCSAQHSNRYSNRFRSNSSCCSATGSGCSYSLCNNNCCTQNNCSSYECCSFHTSSCGNSTSNCQSSSH